MYNNIIRGKSLSLILLISFAFIRPLSLAFEDFAGIPVQKIFPVIISYLLLITVLLNFRRLKLDLISALIFMFCFYSCFSILWGTQIEELARVVLPFIIFFAVRLYAKDIRDINVLIIALIIGYIFPIIGSAFLIFKGTSIGQIEYYSGIARYKGLFPNMHPFAHAMTFFSFVICFLFQQNKIKSKILKYGLVFLLGLLIFCLYKSFVRNAYVSFLIFWFVVFLGVSKKHAFVFLIILLIFGFFYSQRVENIIWKGQAHELEHTLNAASSGRLAIWTHNLSIFSQLTFDRKILGLGLGVDSGNFGSIGSMNNNVWPSHNDYLSLIMTLGILGLTGYIFILIILMRYVYMSGVEKRIKFIFLGVLFSIFTINFLSNGYIFRIEMSQQLWFLMGIFYKLNELNDDNGTNIREMNLTLR